MFTYITSQSPSILTLISYLLQKRYSTICPFNFIVDYLQIIAEPAVKASTLRGYKSAIEKRLKPKFGHVKIKSLTPKMISAYYNELLKEGLTEEFISYIHAILKNASKTAIDWKYIKNDFMNNVKAPKRQKKSVETWHS